MTQILSARWRGRVLVCVLAAVMALPLVTRAGSAVADDRPRVDCPFGPCFPPPPLLNLERGLAVATPEQVESLRNLEAQAVENVIDIHDLAASDTNAVYTWGRAEAQAQLFALLIEAFSDTSRSTDQENAVAWLRAMAQRKAVAAAEAAGREYVKWAGLNEGGFEQQLSRNASESELTEFLNDPPETWAFPHLTTGYCAYRSPAPYGSEYTGYNVQTCFTSCTSLYGYCPPPTPSFEQFVKWGESAASYSLLNTEEFARTARRIGAAVGVSIALAAAVAAVMVSQALLGPTLAMGLAALANTVYMGTTLWAPSIWAPFSTVATGAAPVAAVALIVIVAIVVAVIALLQMFDAAELPGQLAELIVDARTNPPEASELTADTATVFALFVEATLPEPVDEYCDNSSDGRVQVPGAIWYTKHGKGPCLNATAIPEASPFDPQFLIKEEGESTGTLSPTITWRDEETDTTNTARLHDNWFIVEPTGSYDVQTLSITYTDWDGEYRQAFLLGNPTAGYVFVSMGTIDDTDVDLSDCLDDRLCSESETLQYVGPEGEKLSASVRGWGAAVGAPAYNPTPVESRPTSYYANGFAPANATGEVTYEWRFQKPRCVKPCVALGTIGDPAYGDPVAGATVSHTWAHPGKFKVELTATDGEGRSATTTFEVQVGNVPPWILEFVPDCPKDAAGDPVPGPNCLARSGGTATPRQLRGLFVDGKFDLTVSINWGDGTPVVSDCIVTSTTPRHATEFCPATAGNGLELRPVEVAGNTLFEFDASHVYTEPGVYHGTTWVSDGLGSSAEEFTMTIGETADVLVSTNTADGVVRVAEGDDTGHDLEVRLAARPSTDVTVYFMRSNGEVEVPDSVTFTPDNWDQPQPVTVRADDDDFHEDNPHQATITIGVINGAEAHVSIDGDTSAFRSTVPVEISDDDHAGLVVSPTALTLTEAGPAATVTVGVSSPPVGGAAEVTATTSGLCTVWPERLTNIQEPQRLTVTPGRDHAPAGRLCTVHLVSDSTDPAYQGLTADIGGPVTNIDLPAVTVTPTDLALDTTVATPTAGYQVVLDTMPIADVAITPTTGDPTVTVSGPVTFTPDNWDQPQTVTLTAPSDITPHTAVITHEVAADDPTYTTVTLTDVNVAVGDPATTITLTATPDQPTTTKPATVTATFTAQVGTPTGAVVFRVDGVSACDTGTGGCDTDIVDGVAHYNLRLRPGTHTITATYPGDATHRPATATIDVNVTAGTPEPVDDTLTIPEDAANTVIDVLANDPDRDALMIAPGGTTQPANGVADCSFDLCSYKPNPDFHGTDSFTYTVTELSRTHTATATVTITVTPVNELPVAVADTSATAEDTAATIEVVGNDSDVEGDPLTVEDHTQPADGEVACDESSCTYTPDRDFHGTDSFTYTVSDGDETATATVTVTVNSVNDAPVAVADTSATAEDTAATIEVVGNDSDVEGDPLTVEDHTQPADGEVACDESSCTYTPDRDFHGTDSFTYTVSDGDDTATATVTVTVNSVNDAPVAVADTSATAEDTAATIEVVGNDSDVEGDPLTVEDHTQPANGEVTCDATSCTYTPHRDFNGTDTFTYTVSDGDETATATVTITVDPANDRPVAVADSYTAVEDITLEVAAAAGVLANDRDVDGDGLAAVVEAAPAHGTVTLHDDGSFTYTPTAGYLGPDSFTYRAGDPHGAMSQVAPVSLTVVAPAATVTGLTAAPNPSRAGQPVTFTASVTATGTGVTAGTVTFAEGATTLAADVAVDDQGRARFTTASLAEGTHPITATYHPAPGWVGSTSGSVTHLVDGDVPRANSTLSAAPNAAGWHNTDATVIWNWSDQGAGLDPAHCPDRTTSTGAGEVVVTATCRDVAGNQATAQRTVRVDQTAPTVMITAPAARRYYQHADVTADYTCVDRVSGMAACTGNVTDGASIDTSTLGTHHLTTTARDVAGNERTATVSYIVAARPTCHGRPATIIGTAGDDVMMGTPGPDVIVTGGGRDWVRARGGDDTICTGGVRDVVVAGAGNDTISAGGGRDSVFGGLGADTNNGGPGADILAGGAGPDLLRGGAGNDLLIGSEDDDHLDGGPLVDMCRGGGGNDHATRCELGLGIP